MYEACHHCSCRQRPITFWNWVVLLVVYCFTKFLTQIFPSSIASCISITLSSHVPFLRSWANVLVCDPDNPCFVPGIVSYFHDLDFVWMVMSLPVLSCIVFSLGFTEALGVLIWYFLVLATGGSHITDTCLIKIIILGPVLRLKKLILWCAPFVVLANC